jgi:EAL domain-containing protein (putative c-di-GMP-specific phosphodiesterase class I)
MRDLPRNPVARALLVPAAASLALVGLAVARLAVPDTEGLMWFAAIPISVLGMTVGLRAGIAAAAFATAAALAAAVTGGNEPVIEDVSAPITFFLLGGVSGYFAHGALGEYNPKVTAARAELRQAMRAGEISLNYQPALGSDGTVTMVEALARWQHPTRGELLPAEFIPLAEADEATIRELTLQTIELAARDAALWFAPVGIAVAVNLSTEALPDDRLPTQMARILAEAEVDPELIVVELTEGALADHQGTEVALREIRAIGVRVALDDFGVGHSSLARLAELPIDVLKVDQLLTRSLDQPETRALIGGIVELGHALGLLVIVEGVETASELGALSPLGCDAVQGFHFCRPQRPEALAERLADPIGFRA